MHRSAAFTLIAALSASIHTTFDLSAANGLDLCGQTVWVQILGQLPTRCVALSRGLAPAHAFGFLIPEIMTELESQGCGED